MMMVDDAETPEYFLWRFMIAEPHQGRGDYLLGYLVAGGIREDPAQRHRIACELRRR